MSKIITEIRKEKGISIQEMAQLMEVDIDTYRAYENNLYSMTSEQLKKVSKILQTSVDELVFGRDVQPIDISMLTLKQQRLFTEFVSRPLNESEISTRVKNICVPAEHYSLGDSMKYVRVMLLRMTRHQFANLVKVNESSISNWESGIYSTSVSKYVSIAQNTGISMDYYLFDNYPLTISSSALSELTHNVVTAIKKYYIEYNKNEKGL